jgi:hypothetical protein
MPLPPNTNVPVILDGVSFPQEIQKALRRKGFIKLLPPPLGEGAGKEVFPDSKIHNLILGNLAGKWVVV